jgi:tRNA (guanine-N7-)-methyltransferase
MSAASGTREGLRQRRLYGRRRGRALRQGQRALLRDFLPRLSIALPERGRVDPGRLFAASIREVWLEVGFGAGEHLAVQAQAHPDIGVLGCEVFEPGIARLLAEIRERKLVNVRLFADDARLLMAALAPQSLARAFILFPDPWPKERHKKRRIVAAETLDDLAAAMIDGAELRIATDDPDYAQWIEARVGSHPAFETAQADPRPADWPQTRYEKKAASGGRRARLFLYRRRSRHPA